MAFDLGRELVELTGILHSAGVEYAICGGIAVAIHGFPRATRDIDILIKPEDAERVEVLAAKAGFSLSAGIIPFDAGTEKERKVLRVSKAEGDDLLTLDLILVGPSLQSVWDQRMTGVMGATPITVVSRQGLISMKRLAGRPVDLMDIQHLESGN